MPERWTGTRTQRQGAVLMQHGRSASRLRGGSKRSISSLQAFPNRRLAKIASLDGPCTILQQSHAKKHSCRQRKTFFPSPGFLLENWKNQTSSMRRDQEPFLFLFSPILQTYEVKSSYECSSLSFDAFPRASDMAVCHSKLPAMCRRAHPRVA